MYNISMHPDSKNYKPASVRYTMGKLKALGITQEFVAKKLGKSSRALRNYTSGRAKCDYPMQYAIESMLAYELRSRTRFRQALKLK